MVRHAAHLFVLFLWLLCSGIPCVDLSLLLIDDCFVIRVREEGSVMLPLSSGVRCADCLCTVRIVDNDGRTLLYCGILYQRHGSHTGGLSRAVRTCGKPIISTDLALIMYITALGRFGTFCKVFGINRSITQTGDRQLSGLRTYRILYDSGRNRELGVGQILMNPVHHLAP